MSNTSDQLSLSTTQKEKMFTASTSRRLTVVNRILNSPKPYLKRTSTGLETLRESSTKTQVTIGDVSKDVSEAKHPEYVPVKYLRAKQSQHTLRHLRWMLQKDLLGQDMFLMGRPGPARRRLAMKFLQITGRELEFVALSRDTTEADLKQRREIQGGSSRYFDQSAVRAAVEGRVLVLEGVEKAERNVLPVLNNLLENREMHLEDGRFLIPAKRYDKLLEEHTVEELNKWQLVRVSDDFRVIALGLPVPKYQGNPLDPPLRSRFQARSVDTESFKELQEELLEDVPHADKAQVGQLLSCCFSLLSPEAAALSVPDFPAASLPALVKLLAEFPSLPLHSLVSRAYPYRSLLGAEGVRAVEDLLATFNVTEPERAARLRVDEVRVPARAEDVDGAPFPTAAVTISSDGNVTQVEVPCGAGGGGSPPPRFVDTPYQESLLAQLMQSHVVGDVCVIGPRGCGKSATVRQLAARLGYTVEPIVLFQDMTSRDLVQQRTTLPNGDTVWHDSPLVTAAIDGHLAVLDGLHRVHPGTLAVVHRLSQDRELQLHDGRRLLRDDRYRELQAKLGWTEEQMSKAGVQRIHPSFRMVALAEPPSSGKGSTQWLTPELLNLFLFHEMRPLSSEEELSIITDLYGKPSKPVRSVVDVAHFLRESEDPTLRALASSLSTRQLLRIARRMASFPTDGSYDAVQRASLARFLPNIARQSLEKLLSGLNVEKERNSVDSFAECIIEDGSVKIRNTSAKRYPDTAAKSKVPDILFYDVPQHLVLLEALLQDFVLGEHLLLVGNQGVGKNKLADRLLQLLNRPREYIQLHRDTTVQTLTLQPTVRDGIVVYDDSPLVTAVKLGHVLVVDEADKAPTHVTCILKTLVESGEMILSDGRRIVPSNDIRASSPSPNIIPIHPEFRMIVLANRPGFPFLGNDFFGALGDLFSCHAVDNPSPESERALLKSYGPDVPDALVERLVRAFGELRDMADQGLVNYPYSTREVVNIVKHLQKFPDEGLASVVSNVFDFDQHSKETLETLVSVLHKHGIPVGAKPTNISLATELSLPPLKLVAQWLVVQTQTTSLGVEERLIKVKKAVTVPHENFTLDRVEARSSFFSEMQSYCRMPMNDNTIVTGLAVTKGPNFAEDIIHVATVNPLSVVTMSPYKDKATYLSLQGLLGSYRYGRSQMSLVALEGNKKGSLLVHEGSSNSLVLLDTEEKVAHPLPVTSFFEQATDKIFGSSRDAVNWLMVPVKDTNSVVLYEKGGSKIELINVDDMIAYSLSVPFEISSLHPTGSETWLLSDSDERRYSLKKNSPNDGCPYVLRTLCNENANPDVSPLGTVLNCDSTGLGSKSLSEALKQKISAPNRLISTSKSLATIVVGFPDLDLSATDVYAWNRDHGISSKSSPVIMSDIGQLIRPVKVSEVPTAIAKQNDQGLAGYLEVVDVVNHKMRFIPVPEAKASSGTSSFMYTSTQQPLFIAERSNNGLVSVDHGGCVRLWETGLAELERSLDEWQKMVGTGRDDLELTVDRVSGLDVSSPKHGKVDPKNDPHVGGNTWAGGTGGRDTAGLGGKGGPYRLDAGHKVHQLSDEEKNAVPEHVKKAAREMGQRAFQQRLKEIQMSQYDAKLYEEFHKGVSKQIQSLRVILGSLQAKSKERQWLRHQTSGELDDTKLIEGLTGEKTIYRRRAEAEPELGAPQLKPKRLRLVVDVSGSMYRFNGYDGRLDREMEAMVLVMEAFQGHEDKIRYDIHGHSGEGYGVEFVEASKPPKDNKERLNVIKTMHAHAQFCMSGDHTLPATKAAISSIAQEDCDEAIVVILSDANLERYGIPPKRFALALTEESKVNAYAIFIGSLGDQATRLARQMPAGRAFVCMDLKNIPQILQQIFTASMLSSA